MKNFNMLISKLFIVFMIITLFSMNAFALSNDVNRYSPRTNDRFVYDVEMNELEYIQMNNEYVISSSITNVGEELLENFTIEVEDNYLESNIYFNSHVEEFELDDITYNSGELPNIEIEIHNEYTGESYSIGFVNQTDEDGHYQENISFFMINGKEFKAYANQGADQTWETSDDYVKFIRESNKIYPDETLVPNGYPIFALNSDGIENYELEVIDVDSDDDPDAQIIFDNTVTGEAYTIEFNDYFEGEARKLFFINGEEFSATVFYGPDTVWNTGDEYVIFREYSNEINVDFEFELFFDEKLYPSQERMIKYVSDPNVGSVEISFEVFNNQDQNYDNNYQEIEFYNSEYISSIQNFNDYGVDEDGDGLFEEFVISFDVDLSVGGEYQFRGYLEIDDHLSDKRNINDDYEYFEEGWHTIVLRYPGHYISMMEDNRTYVLEEFKFSKVNRGVIYRDDDNIYTTAVYYHEDFIQSPVQLTGNYNEYLFDEDDNGLYDFLVIEAEIESTINEECEIDAIISKTQGEHMSYIFNHEFDVQEGLNNVELSFYGPHIRDFGGNSTYLLDEVYFECENVEGLSDYKDNPYQTNFYNHTMFDFYPVNGIYNMSDSAIDTDGNGLYDYLVISFDANITKNHEIEFDSELKNEFYNYVDDYVSEEINYETGLQNINLYFEGEEIYNRGEYFDYEGLHNYIVNSLYIHDETDDIYFGINFDEYTTNEYDHRDFDLPAIFELFDINEQGVDFDGDGYFDELVINFTINVTENGYYEFISGLKDYENWGSIDYFESEEVFLEEGLNYLSLHFDGREIREYGIATYYIPYINFYNVYDNDKYYNFDAYYYPNDYSYNDFELPFVTNVSGVSEYLIDDDDNGDYNYLALNFTVESTEEGYYMIESTLKDSEGNLEITTSSSFTFLDLGNNTASINFYGSDIYDSHINGPYYIEEIRIRYVQENISIIDEDEDFEDVEIIIIDDEDYYEFEIDYLTNTYDNKFYIHR